MVLEPNLNSKNPSTGLRNEDRKTGVERRAQILDRKFKVAKKPARNVKYVKY